MLANSICAQVKRGGLLALLVLVVSLGGQFFGNTSSAWAQGTVAENALASSQSTSEVYVQNAEVDNESGIALTSSDVELKVILERNYDYAYQVLALVNEERAKEGLSALAMDEDLLQAAMVRAAECALFFSHTRPDGSSCFTISSKLNAENIAYNQKSPAAVMNSWMNSTGHRNNILSSGARSIGIGCIYVGMSGPYWVQCFGSGVAESGAQPSNVVVTESLPNG